MSSVTSYTYLPADSHALLRAAVDASGLGVWEMDVQTGRINWSERCYELFWLEPGTNISYRNFLDALHPEDWQRTDAMMRHAYDPAGDGRYDTEYRTVSREHPDRIRWVRATGQAFFNEHRQAYRIVGTVHDITARKEAEQQLLESEKRFRTMANSAPVLMWMSGPDKGCDYFNAGWLEFTGRTMEQELGNGWAEGVHPDDLDRCWQIYSTSFDRHEPFRMEYRLRRHDGQYRWLIDTGAPRYSPDGTFLGFIGTCVDVQHLKDTEAALLQREAEFTTLADNLPQLIWMTDAAGNALWYNRRWYEYTGTTLAEMVNWGWQQVHHPEHLQRVTDKFLEHLSTGEPWEDTFPIRGANGEFRWFLSRARPVRDASGQITRWFGTNTDVTEQQAALVNQLTTDTPAATQVLR
jgi:PAS domain S-box-containing protein